MGRAASRLGFSGGSGRAEVLRNFGSRSRSGPPRAPVASGTEPTGRTPQDFSPLHLPCDGDARIGKVGTVGAGANRSLEVGAQRRMVSRIRPMACRTARVTLALARSATEPTRRSRPPSPIARDNSRERKSSSAVACATRDVSPSVRASSRSSVISVSRRRYTFFARASSTTPASPSSRADIPGSGA